MFKKIAAIIAAAGLIVLMAVMITARDDEEVRITFPIKTAVLLIGREPIQWEYPDAFFARSYDSVTVSRGEKKFTLYGKEKNLWYATIFSSVGYPPRISTRKTVNSMIDPNAPRIEGTNSIILHYEKDWGAVLGLSIFFVVVLTLFFLYVWWEEGKKTKEQNFQYAICSFREKVERGEWSPEQRVEEVKKEVRSEAQRLRLDFRDLYHEVGEMLYHEGWKDSLNDDGDKWRRE